MTTTITHPAGEILPTAVDGFTANRTAQTRIHRVLGRADPDVSFRVASLRTGELTLWFNSGADAAAAEATFAGISWFDLDNPEVPQMNMRFVVGDGDISLTINDTRSAWFVTVPYVEISS